MIFRETTCNAEGLLTCACERDGVQFLLAHRTLHGSIYDTAYLQRRPFWPLEHMGMSLEGRTGPHTRSGEPLHTRCAEV